jgi:hypothetical protein
MEPRTIWAGFCSDSLLFLIGFDETNWISSSLGVLLAGVLCSSWAGSSVWRGSDMLVQDGWRGSNIP